MTSTYDGHGAALPDWVIFEQRPFPDANLLLLAGGHPALIDSGYVDHAEQTRTWATERTGHAERVQTVINTHWHSDHIGGNALLQRSGSVILAGTAEADAINRRDPGCCLAEYLDQPVPQYTVDRVIVDGEVLRLGGKDWLVVATPGHTPGHLCLFQPDERVLITGDAMSDYDVGWVNLAVDGPDAAETALASIRRLRELAPRMIIPAHGPIPADSDAAFTHAERRAQRLVGDPDGAVWYGARRIFAYALMIRHGIPRDDVMPYLLARAWLHDAALLLRRGPEEFADELITTMLAKGAIAEQGGRLVAAAPHSSVTADALTLPFPRDWEAAKV